MNHRVVLSLLEDSVGVWEKMMIMVIMTIRIDTCFYFVYYDVFCCFHHIGLENERNLESNSVLIFVLCGDDCTAIISESTANMYDSV